MQATFSIQRSSIDEERFGVRTSRALVTTTDEAARALADSARDGSALLIVRCPATDLSVVQYLEEQGARLMDVLVYFERKLDQPLPSAGEGRATIRSARAEDERALAEIARGAFTSYLGHYHADPRLERSACDEAYVSWAEHALRARSADAEVLVAEAEGTPVGFVTVHMNTPDEAEIALNGVAPAMQGRGINRTLLLGALAWARGRGAARLLISTQVANTSAQRSWCRVGFEPAYALYTLHHWFRPRAADETR